MFILVLSGLLYRPKRSGNFQLPRIKLLLPAYKPDARFSQVLEQLKMVTEGQSAEVFILFQYADLKYYELADELDFEYEIKAFDHLNGNSYQHALRYLAAEHLPEGSCDYVMILDKDNLMAADFFQELKKIDLSGFDLVQSVRRPLETAHGLQVFDALSERLNDLMLRAGKCFWGGPAELSGSAALIKTDIFKDCIKQLDPKAPGFDKNFMVNLLTSYPSLRTEFSKNLVVYEEKTATVQNYDGQRLRWFGEQYYNAFYKAGKLLGSVLKGNLKCLDYWVSLARPPRIVLFAMSFLLAAIDLWDSMPGILSIPFVLNYLTFLMVAFPYLDQIKMLDLIKGGLSVLRSNVYHSLTSLKSKHLGTFIHTR
ncbi:MAG: hypothetical protein R8G66_22365 [Cytophagales bacterium]|nr:hypothetical protein [Cytophagales bacterium]